MASSDTKPIPTNVPIFDIDYYSDAVILDPYPLYAAMREAGPVIYLPSLGNYAVTRYDQVREVLQHWQAFSSEYAIAGDDFGCKYFQGASNLFADPPLHDTIRVKMAAPLLPKSLEAIRERVEALANDLIDRLVERENFDGMADLARYLPTTLVTDLVGLPDDGRENMLDWAAAAFDITGIQNERGCKGAEVLNEMRHWIVTQATPDRLKPGSLTARIRDMVSAGDIPEHLFLGIMNDYITPSLDTTISATGQLLYQLARNPEQWAQLRNDPSLIENAVNEAVRVGSPIRSFTRAATRDYTIAGTRLPKGSRVMAIYASANRDERKFPNPDYFDVTRVAPDHVGFGHGIHMCVGMHLAKLEMASLLKAMINRVETIEVGEPTLVLNNTIHAFETLPTRFTPSTTTRLPQTTQQRTTQEAPALTSVDDNWIGVTIARRSVVAVDTIALELTALDGGDLPPFEPGSHIDIEIAEGLVRQYSLCGDPRDSTRYRLGILRDPKSRGGSEAVHDTLLEGSRVRISRPRNFFPLAERMPGALLFAGGIGVTPLMAMAMQLQAEAVPFTFHYANRTGERAAFLEEMTASAYAASIRAHVDANDGPFDAAALIAEADRTHHIYVCGPQGFIDHVTHAAASAGWPVERVHVEHFAATPVLTGAPFDVVARRSGKTFHIPCDRTILDVLNEGGIAIPSSCHSGVCSTCMTTVLEGEPDHRDMVLTADERAKNDVMAVCCSRSKTRLLVLDV